MLKVLLKKQLTEIFRSYFYDAKKNKARSKGSIIAYLALYVFMMLFLCAIFAGLSISVCPALVSSELDWLYFALMGLISVLLGAFGSVFNTYSGLYLAKDNDLLLSMPIPVKYIMMSRLLGVYIIGALYSCVVSVPAAVVYTAVSGLSFASVVCPLLFALLITVLVMTLSCALGWITAKISQKLKNKSFITVIISLAFFGLYYLISFKAQDIITTLVSNASVYGDKIKTYAYPVYIFGAAATGELLPLAVTTAIILLLFAVSWILISRSFINIASDSGKRAVKKLKSISSAKRSVSAALISKEFSKFTSSPAYMLNCGLGTVIIIIAAVMVLIKGEYLLSVLSQAIDLSSCAAGVLLCFSVCLICSMNDICAPSISLEGKNIWLLQSLPIKPVQVLYAKLSVQLIVTAVPALLCVIAVQIVCRMNALCFILALAGVLLYVLFYSLFCLTVSLKLPNLTWTSEITPLKQGGSVMLSMLIGFVVPFIFAGLAIPLMRVVAPELYMGIFAIIMLVLSLVMVSWMKKKGSEIFAAL